MKKIYFATSYQKREEFKPLYQELLHTFKVSSPVFDYHPSDENDYHSLMQHAFSEIDNCDLVLADVTYKEIGIGIEVGFAKAKNIPIIYIRRDQSELSTTTFGIATLHHTYKPGNYQEIIDLCLA